MKFDDILRQIGELGPFQMKIVFLVALAMLPEALNSMIAVFATADMDHWCHVEEWTDSVQNCNSNLTTFGQNEQYIECIHKYRDASIPIKKIDDEPVYANCIMYDKEYPSELTEEYYTGDSENSTRGCTEGWVYDRSQYRSTIVSEFDLVCDKKKMAAMTQSIFYVGYLVGSWASGSLADAIGRYYTLFIAVSVDIIAGVILAFSPSYWFFCIFRFLVGVSNISLYLMAFVIATEILGPSKRIYGGMAIPLAFSFGYMLLAFLAYMIRNWRHLQLAASGLLVPIFLLIPILPESARWLMARKKYEKAEKIIKQIAKGNKTTDKLPENTVECLIKEEEENFNRRTYTTLDLLRTPKLRRATLMLFFIWPANSLIYFGLSLNTAKFGSNQYMTFFIAGFVEVPGILMTVPFMQSRFGRRYTISGVMALSGVACLVTVITSDIFLTVAAMTGKFCITAAYMSIYVFSAEIFPTEVRSIGVGSCSTAARLGSILAPMVLVMFNDIWEPLPLLLFGCLALTAAGLVLLLPETRGKVLTATIEEGEEFLRNPHGKISNSNEDSKI